MDYIHLHYHWKSTSMCLFSEEIKETKIASETSSLMCNECTNILHHILVNKRSSEKSTLKQVIKMAQNIQLPSVEDIYLSRCQSRTSKIIRDPTHPAHYLFDLLPSGRKYGTIYCHTTRLKNRLKNYID